MDEDLSDDQVVQLLKDAEQRMKSAALKLSVLGENEVVVPPLLGHHTRKSAGLTDALPVPYIRSTSHGAQISSQPFVYKSEGNLANGERRVTHPQALKDKVAKKRKSSSAEALWFNLPRTMVTPELKREMQIIRLRSALDRKRHYKRESGQKNDIPEFFEVGTVIEGPTDFFAARLTKKERRRTLVEEVLAGEKSSQRFKSKYYKIQEVKTSGKKGHYQVMKARRAHGNSKR